MYNASDWIKFEKYLAKKRGNDFEVITSYL